MVLTELNVTIPLIPPKEWGWARQMNRRRLAASPAKAGRLKTAGSMNTLQQALEEATASLPSLFLQKLIDKKLREQGIEPPRGLSEKMAAHFLAGNREPFTFNSSKLSKNVKLTFTEADGDEMVKAMEDFCATKLQKIIPDVARKTARSVLKTLRERWPDEHSRPGRRPERLPGTASGALGNAHRATPHGTDHVT